MKTSFHNEGVDSSPFYYGNQKERGLFMRPNSNFPDRVYSEAHKLYPDRVAKSGLYCVAFFGHARPLNLGHKETTESIWRGLIREVLRGLTDESKALTVNDGAERS